MAPLLAVLPPSGIMFQWPILEVLGASLNWPQRPARSPYRLPKRPGAEKWSS